MRLAIIYGGNSIESDYSRTAYEHLKNLLERKFGEIGGFELNNIVNNPSEILLLKSYDCVLNIVYGNPGQEGAIQGLLELWEIPYIGTEIFGCALIKNKLLMKEFCEKIGLLTPKSLDFNSTINSNQILNTVKNQLRFPIVCKPLENGGLSLGVHYCENLEHLSKIIEDVYLYDNEILIEEFVDGIEIIVCVIETKNSLNILPLIEVKKQSKILNYETKVNKKRELLIDAPSLSTQQKDSVKRTVEYIFRKSHMKSWGYFEFIINDQGIHFIEAGAVPGLTKNSNIPVLLEKKGLDLEEVIYHLALNSVKK